MFNYICKVPNCENNDFENIRKYNITLFKVPQHGDLLPLWEQNLGIKIPFKTWKICDKHFHKRDLKKNKVTDICLILFKAF